MMDFFPVCLFIKLFSVNAFDVALQFLHIVFFFFLINEA